MQIGYIGLGLMGKPMARNILKAGFPLIVHNRSQLAVEELVREGAQRARNPCEVARNADIVFTNLPDSPDVEEVVLGPGGILEGARPGLIYVDNSTIKPGVSRKIAEELIQKGVQALDAPVSGGDIGAREGTLTIMVGGFEEVLDKVRPVLKAVGKKITFVGGPGCGQIAKAANQIMVAAQMVAMGELLVFACKAGANPVKIVEAIKSGAAQCWALDVKPQRLFSNNRQPGFKAKLQSKDLDIVLETARENGMTLPSASIDAELFRSMVKKGMGEMDNSAVVGLFEEMAGIQLVK
jgi:2-hydroxy-3-oxopropionate reductase